MKTERTNSILSRGHGLSRCFWGLLAVLFWSPILSGKQVELTNGLANPVVLAGRPQKTFLKVALFGLRPDGEQRAPVNVALVIDRSASMEGEKMARAKEAAIQAVQRLGPRDVISIVTYDSTVNVLVPATRLTDKASVIARIREIGTGGSTALFAGLAKGAAEIRKFFDRNRVNRIILVSDGLANVGLDSPADLADLGQSLSREQISVTTVGIGQGYNEDLMVKLSENSDGNHAFAESAELLSAVFNREFADILSVVAQEISIHIMFSEGIKPIRLLGRGGTVIGRAVTVRLGNLYGNQEKYALVEIEVPEGAPGDRAKVADVQVDYADIFAGKRESLAGAVNINYTTAEEAVRQNINADAMNSATAQVITYNTKMALHYRDQGQKRKAQELVKSNVSYGDLNFVGENAENQQIYIQNDRALEAVSKDELWQRGGRKLLQEDVYRNRFQQMDYREDTEQPEEPAVENASQD